MAMKKVIKILLPFVAVSSALFSGCDKNKKDSRVLLSFGDIHASETRLIDIEKLAEITNAKENFLFVVSTNTCGCWSDFEPILNTYLAKNKTLCYRIGFAEFKDSAATFGLANASSSTTTFAIFENGKVKSYINSADDKFMYNLDKFTKYMNEQVILPSCYFITKNDVETIKTSGKSAVIYYERSACGDCSELNPGLLRTYIKNHKNINKIYVLDCQEYWRSSTADDYQSYLDFKDEMGLSTANNPTYGYNSGVFPFFSYIENGQYSSGCVIYNDSITKIDDKYVISESYYTSDRVQTLQYTNTVLAGMELTLNEVNEIEYKGNIYYSWEAESKNSHYKEILDSFLDYALPKQTFNF